VRRPLQREIFSRTTSRSLRGVSFRDTPLRPQSERRTLPSREARRRPARLRRLGDADVRIGVAFLLMPGSFRRPAR
jgi:hypothetical protein